MPDDTPAPNAGWLTRRTDNLKRVRAAGAAGLPMGRGDGAGDPPDAVPPADAHTLQKAGLVRVEKTDGKWRVFAVK